MAGALRAATFSERFERKILTDRSEIRSLQESKTSHEITQVSSALLANELDAEQPP